MRKQQSETMCIIKTAHKQEVMQDVVTVHVPVSDSMNKLHRPFLPPL